ncbi:hypothetical protein M433DRAFT_542851, partial [Acidomyces richmondensis BFW]
RESRPTRARYPKPFPVSSRVTEEEILRLLRRLPLNKAPGLDRIIDIFIKAYRHPLAPTLASLFTVYL